MTRLGINRYIGFGRTPTTGYLSGIHADQQASSAPFALEHSAAVLDTSSLGRLKCTFRNGAHFTISTVGTAAIVAHLLLPIADNRSCPKEMGPKRPYGTANTRNN